MTQILSFIPVKIIQDPSIEIPGKLCQGAIAQVHQHREVLQLHHSADLMADLLQTMADPGLRGFWFWGFPGKFTSQLLGCWFSPDANHGAGI